MLEMSLQRLSDKPQTRDFSGEIRPLKPPTNSRAQRAENVRQNLVLDQHLLRNDYVIDDTLLWSRRSISSNIARFSEYHSSVSLLVLVWFRPTMTSLRPHSPRSRR